MLYYREDKTRK